MDLMLAWLIQGNQNNKSSWLDGKKKLVLNYFFLYDSKRGFPCL
jgi:hypothetical protein